AQRVYDRVELGAQARIPEHDLAEALPVQRAVRAQHPLAEGRGDLGQPGRAGYDYFPGGHVRVDEHRAVLSQPPGHLALARPDASGKPDPQQLQPSCHIIRSPVRGSARLAWLIRASWWKGGTIVHRINHVTRIHHDLFMCGTPHEARGTGVGAGVGIGRWHKNAASTRRGERGIHATRWNSGQFWPPDSFSRRAARASSEASVPVAPAPGVELEVTAPGVPPWRGPPERPPRLARGAPLAVPESTGSPPVASSSSALARDSSTCLRCASNLARASAYWCSHSSRCFS